MRRTTAVSTALVLALAAPVLASASEARSPASLRRVTLAGTVRLYGCRVLAAGVRLRARSLPVLDPRTGIPAIPEEVHVAEVVRGGSPAALAFRFREMVVGHPYEIEVPELDGPTDCARMIWRTAARGVVTVKAGTRVRIDGYALRSEIEVRSVRDGRETDVWVGAEALDAQDPEEVSVRRFRWKPNLPGTTSGQIQVSLRPFPAPGPRFAPCTTPPLVYARTFAAADGDWVDAGEVDFGRLARDSRSEAADPSARVLEPKETLRGLTGDERIKTALGAPLYVRVVPLSAQGRPVCAVDRAGVIPIVILAKVPNKKIKQPVKPSVELDSATYAPPVVQTWPKSSQVCYRVTKPHYLDYCKVTIQNPFNPNPFCKGSAYDAYGALLWAQGGVSLNSTVQPGKTFCVTKSSGGGGGWFGDFIDSFGSMVTGLVDSVGELVNAVSALWEKLQDLAVNAVQDTMKALKIPCNAACRQGLELGLEAGLASMGIPPSLPNFDQLVDQGLDYVAAQVAEQTGVPPVIAEYATGKAKEFVEKAAADMKAGDAVSGLPDWLTYDLGLQPAVLTLNVLSNVDEFPVTPFLFLNSSTVFGGASVALPKKFPPSANPLAIPVSLPINLAGLPEPSSSANAFDKARYNKDNWVKQRLTDGCAELAMAAIAYQDWRVFMHAAVQAEVPFSYLTATGPFYCQP